MSAPKLYYAPGACSFVPHVLLEAGGEPFDALPVKLHRNEQNSPDFLRINPRGQVPALLVGDAVVTQIVAIVLYLDDRFASQGFLPREPIARARALQTLAWMNNTVHPTFTHVFMPQKFTDKPELHEELRRFNLQLYRRQLDELQTLVQSRGGEWLSGANFGPLDAYALTLARWGSLVGIDPAERPALWTQVQKVAAHPPAAAVLERERVPLNLYKSA